MNEKSFPFRSVRDAEGKGDRPYGADDWTEYFSKFITNGYFPNDATNLQVFAETGMNVVIKPGAAWINGKMYRNKMDKTLKIDVADGILSRIDRIVVRCDFINREIKTNIKKGTFSSSPIAPALQRDTDIWELGLADIHVKNGTTAITQSHITDLRLSNEMCGVVNSLLQADTTTIFNQFQSWFNQIKEKGNAEFDSWMLEMHEEFQMWFENVKGLLDGDAAGNLSNRITEVDLKVNQHKADTIVHITSEERTSWNGKTDNTNFISHDNNYVKHPIFVTASGNAVTGAYTATIEPLSQYVDGMGIIMKVTTSTSVKATLNVNGLGAKPICMSDGVQVDSLQAGGIYSLRYNASTGAFIVQGEGGIEKPGELYIVNDAKEKEPYMDWQDPIYKKMREILVLKSGKYRVSYEFHAGYHSTARAETQIHINGIPVGKERITFESSYITVVEDLYMKKGDRVQLYGKGNGSNYTRNFKLGVLPFGEIITV